MTTTTTTVPFNRDGMFNVGLDNLTVCGVDGNRSFLNGSCPSIYAHKVTSMDIGVCEKKENSDGSAYYVRTVTIYADIGGISLYLFSDKEF